ncbi:interleukin-17 receptor A isoform X2 [Hemicordylus capensis]|nr:interleukin-17 receptor A isoform X2 [Hemicordylus capensis]XP_053110990.1 interleukin-17 receptor A isoform X2 [Hemicordylus capensis]XP_053110991.1 interleukin-17 receptor A isoform X2 [Hemicordylus capensis]
MTRMGSAPAAVAALSLALLLGTGHVASGLKLLSGAVPFDCSQPGLHCLVRNSSCLDKSWLFFAKWTPSAPSFLDVSIATFFDGEELRPVLKITWMAATDASIQYLRGVQLAVLQINNNRQVCAHFDFQNNLTFQVRPDGGGRWNFSFDRFEVQPRQSYQVTVHHLPKLSTSGDHNRLSKSITVPGCTDPIMKTTAPCVQRGSLWEPSIHGTRLDDESLLLSFNPAMDLANYSVHVTSFQENGETCKKARKEIFEERLQQRLNVTVKIERNLKSCCNFEVQIQPHFATCKTDCERHPIFIPCPLTVSSDRSLPTPTDFEPGVLSVWLPWSLTLIIILLVGSVASWVICCIRKHKVSVSEMSKIDGAFHDPTLSQPVPALKPCKVWIVYSADHKLYVDVVMKLAQFMITVCGTEVVLDLLEERQISEMGAVRWLTRQKQEIEALSSKIIILCSQGTRAKWQAMLGHEEAKVSLKQDNLQPVGDMFTPALNLILPDFKQPACFGMYLVCYFEGISNERDIPDPFNVASKYQLMNRFEEVYFLIQDLEKFEPGRIHQIPEISAEKYAEGSIGRELKEAMQKCQKWQAENPDWFKRENDYLEDDLQSLNEELSEKLTLVEGRILKQQLLPQEPDLSSCCLVNLCINKDESRACRLLPQLPPQEDLAFQTLVIPADESSQVQVIEPVAFAEESEIFSHQLLTNEDWVEQIPMIEPSIPKRNSVILQEDVFSDAQPLPADMRQQLEGLMYSLFQQSISPSEPLHHQDDINQQQQLVFDELCKDQRQSVQSDQGYISRCSPLPSDSPVEEEEEEEDQEQEGHKLAEHLSPDILDSLKSLQQQLFFQNIQQNSVRGQMGERMGML